MSESSIGSYRILETIGSGALSTIYKAVHEPLGRIVALKALKTQIAPTSSFGEQLERESKVLVDLAHPNVVLLLDASRTASGRPYIVLEHVDGPSLHEVLARSQKAEFAPRAGKKGLGVPATLAIACGLCAALEHIHERGIVHRDIKPSNLLLSRSGVVKLIDFGIAQRPRTGSVSDGIGAEGITASGRIAPEPIKDAFGTPAYMSPEQILGDFVDGRSDLFSLGVVLYTMLSGSRPFEALEKDDGKRSSTQRIRRDTPTPLRERAPHCPRAVERIVMRLLEKSPNDRYPSASAVRERLEAALRAETRDDPGSIVRGALSKAGYTSNEDDDRSQTTEARSGPSGGDRPRVPLARVLLGFAAIGLAFVIAAAVNEGTNTRAREGRAAGARALELAPERAGGLRVVATPWAHVRVDGQLVETTPFARPIPLAPGKHWVTLEHPDAPSTLEREITIVTGETVSLEVTMKISADDAGKDAR